TRRIARSLLGLLLLAAGAAASGIDGVWVGQQPRRRGGSGDLAVRFKVNGQSGTGQLFGGEDDLPISEGSGFGGQIRVFVTTTNYYNGTKTRFVYQGTIKGNEMELTRERMQTPPDKAGKQSLKLKRVE